MCLPDFIPNSTNVVRPLVDYIPPNKSYDTMLAEMQKARQERLSSAEPGEKIGIMLGEHLIQSGPEVTMQGVDISEFQGKTNVDVLKLQEGN